jgi:hypothetical protein
LREVLRFPDGELNLQEGRLEVRRRKMIHMNPRKIMIPMEPT